MTNRTDLSIPTTPFLWVSLLGKKKKKSNQNPRTELLLLGPSSFGHLQGREPPPCPGPGSESHKSHSSSRTHSLGIPHRILTTGKPFSPAYLYHLKCLGSTIPCLATGLFLMTSRISRRAFFLIYYPPSPPPNLLALKCFGSRAQLRNENKGSTRALCVQGGRSVGSPGLESVAPSNCTSGPRAP